MNKEYIRKSKGLSTGAAVAIVCSSCFAICFIAAMLMLLISRDANVYERIVIEPQAVDIPLTADEIYENFSDAVFIIYTYDEFGNREANGSGFFIREDGVAVTNHHVLEGAESAVIVTNDDVVFHIDGFYNYDMDNDLAVFQVRGSGFPYLVIGDSEAVRVGESVYAIGSPHGYRNTFSVSYVSMRYSDFYFDIYAPEEVIQVTAPLYPGSSGGALLNTRGEVVGVVCAHDASRASVAYAVPVIFLDLSNIDDKIYSLPVTSGETEFDSKNFYDYANFPGIADFLSVSPNAVLTDEENNMGEIRNFDFSEIFVYDLPRRSFLPDTDRYDIVLVENGFVFQDVINSSNSVTVFLFNYETNESVVYIYYTNTQRLAIGIGLGNALTMQ